MSVKQKYEIIRPGRVLCRDERGIALITALLFLMVLTVLGTTAVMISSTDIKIGGNYRSGNEALYAAEAGVEEARGRLKGTNTDPNYAGDPATSPDPVWSAYILTSNSWQPTTNDPNYDSSYLNYIPIPGGSHTNTAITTNSLQAAIQCSVKIRHKREYEAEQAGHITGSTHYFDGDGSTATHTAASRGNIIYWGYGNSATPTTTVQFTTGGATAHKPVEIIAAYGRSGDSSKRIEIEVVHNPGPPITAALYAKGNVTGNGSALSVDGNDNCGGASAVPPIYTLSPSTTILNGSPTLSGNPASPQVGSKDINIVDSVNSLKNSATVTITSDENGVSYGNVSNFVTAYSDTSNPSNVGGLKLQNVTGYGTLLVTGDLTLGGGFNWNGLILVTGTLTFNGGGAGINIQGAVLAEQTIDLNGGITVGYDSCMIKKAFDNQSLQIIGWKEVY